MSQIQWSAITFPTPIILLHIFQVASFTHNLHDCQKINSKFQREHGFSGVGIVMAHCHNFPTCEVAPIELKFRQYVNYAIAYTIWTFIFVLNNTNHVFDGLFTFNYHTITCDMTTPIYRGMWKSYKHGSFVKICTMCQIIGFVKKNC